jgi:hypothetical protein
MASDPSTANVPRSQRVVSKLLWVKRRWKPTEFPSAVAR